MNKTDFSKRLKKAMQLRKITASTLSKKTGIKPPMISDYLSGKYNAKQDKIHLLAEALNVNEFWLMGYDADIERIPNKLNDNKNKDLIDKINNLTSEQKDIILKLIDNMK